MRKGFCFLILLFVLSGKAQPPRSFYTTFGGAGDDVAYSVKVTMDGNYIVAGSSSSFGMGNTDVYLVKLDSMGNTIWSKTFGGILSDVGRSVIQLPDSGFAIAGYGNSFGAGGYDAYVFRTDKYGTVIWQQSFGGTDWDFANDLVLGADGNLYVVGYTYSFGAGKKDGFILKYDLSGNLLLQKLIGGTLNEELNSIMKAADNSLVTVGYTESDGEINGDALVVKLNSSLDTVFMRRFGGPGRDFACDIVQKLNSDFMVCGAKTYSTGGNTHSYILRISDSGTYVLENNEFRNNGDEFFVSLANSLKTDFYTGFVRTLVIPNKPDAKKQADFLIANPSGYSQFYNDSGDSQDEIAYALEGTQDGGFVVVGSTESYGSIGTDCYFVKRDTSVINYPTIQGVFEQRLNNGFVYQNDNKVYYTGAVSDIDILKVYDLKGTLIGEAKEFRSKLIFDGTTLTSGTMYILTVQFKDGHFECKKLFH